MHSLDLLYEKETTAKLLEFKLKYLVSYATLMQNYFSHMNFADIVQELVSKDDERAVKLMLIAAMVVGPQETVSTYIFRRRLAYNSNDSLFRLTQRNMRRSRRSIWPSLSNT